MGVPLQHCACVAALARQAMQSASQRAGMPVLSLDEPCDQVRPQQRCRSAQERSRPAAALPGRACSRQGASGAAALGALGGLAARVAQTQRAGGALLVGVVAAPARFRKLAARGLFPLAALDGVSFMRLDLGAPLDAQGQVDAVLVKVRCGHLKAATAWPALWVLSVARASRPATSWRAAGAALRRRSLHACAPWSRACTRSTCA